MANYLQRLIMEGKENLPALINKLKGQSDDVAKKAAAIEGEVIGDLATIPKQKVLQDIEGEVIQPKAPLMIEAPIASKVDDVVNAASETPLMLTPPKSPSIPYGKIAAGGVAAGIGAGMLYNAYSENDENKEVTSAPMATPKNIPLPQINKESTKTSVKGVKTSSLPTPEKNPVEIEGVAKKQEDDFEARLAAAQDADVDRNRLFGLLKAAQMGGSALASAKADTSYADDQLKTSDFNVGNLKAGETLKEANNKVLEEKLMRDPNSDISKQARAMLASVYPDLVNKNPDLSAAQMEKMGLNMGQLAVTKEQREARKETQRYQNELLNANKQTKMEEGNKKLTGSHIDYYTKLLHKDYQTLQKAETDARQSQEMLDNVKMGITPGVKDIASLYRTVKGLDRNSAVREGEIALSKQARSLLGRLESGAKQITGGDLLDQATRESFNELIKAAADAERINFAKQKKNAIAAGVEKGIDPASIERGLYADIPTKNTENSTTIPKTAIAEKVRIKNIKTGQEKTVDSATAQQILMNPNYQAVK